MPRNKDGLEFSEAMLSKVAWLYFICGLTQNEIAEQLGTTRLRINKALGAARDEGFVRIEIISPFASTHELERELVEKYSLTGARVGVLAKDSDDYHESVGTALAYYLNEQLSQNKIKKLGVSWGTTLEFAVKNLISNEDSGIEVVSLLGGLSKGTSINTFGIAASYAARLKAQYQIFAAPLYSETVESTKALLETSLLKEQIANALNVDAAIFVVGDMSKKSLLIREGLPKGVSAAELKAKGAVGDILGRFLNKHGEPIDHPINSRAISPPHDSITSINHRVLAAAGTHKVPIIHAALTAGLIQTLVTDENTARKLMKL